MMIQTNQEILLLNLQMNLSTNFPGKIGNLKNTHRDQERDEYNLLNVGVFNILLDQITNSLKNRKNKYSTIDVIVISLYS